MPVVVVGQTVKNASTTEASGPLVAVRAVCVSAARAPSVSGSTTDGSTFIDTFGDTF